jgi:hypothetical protein
VAGPARTFGIANQHVAMPKAGVAAGPGPGSDPIWEPVLLCFAGKRRAQKLTIGLRLSPIPVCSQINNYDRDQLWTSAALVVDGLGVRLRGFRKSHHFIPAAPR